MSGRSPVDREQLGALLRETATLLPDVVLMLRGVLRDDRVPRDAKIQTGALLAYIVSPIDLLPDMIPVLGQLDDVAVAAFAVHRLLLAAGEPVLREHWRGSDRGFQLLLSASAALAVPRGKLRSLGLIVAVTGLVRGVRSGGDPVVVEGEVVPPRSQA